MKNFMWIFVTNFLLLTSATSSAGSERNVSSAEFIEGEYTHRLRQCEGTINPTDCITSAEGIEIKKRSSNSYYLYVRTRTGSIFHSCEYVAIAKRKGNQLISGRKDYCNVNVSFEDGVASVSSYGEGCRDFCSAQASLLASNLTKKMPRVQSAKP
ncbi:MAG: hypothetical protein V4713_12120 [Pseudomonadota bacterium]